MLAEGESLLEEKKVRIFQFFSHQILILTDKITATQYRKVNKIMRIFVVEDDKVLHHLIAKRLKEEGHSVDDCYDGESGFDYADSMQYGCIILDLMLPKRDGISILRELRNKGNASPVLILTARDSIDDRVVGLDAGADDYLVKPLLSTNFLPGFEHCCAVEATPKTPFCPWRT